MCLSPLSREAIQRRRDDDGGGHKSGEESFLGKSTYICSSRKYKRRIAVQKYEWQINIIYSSHALSGLWSNPPPPLLPPVGHHPRGWHASPSCDPSRRTTTWLSLVLFWVCKWRCCCCSWWIANKQIFFLKHEKYAKTGDSYIKHGLAGVVSGSIECTTTWRYQGISFKCRYRFEQEKARERE